MLIKSNRRKFLGALGTATFAASTMRFFLKNAEAQAFPKRFVFIFTPNGSDSAAASTGLGADYTLGPDMQMFNDIKHKFSVLDGLRIPPHGGEEHPSGRCAMLSSWKSSGTNATAGNRGQSFDIFLRNKLTNGNSIYMGTDAPDDALDQPISWISPGAMNGNFVGGGAPNPVQAVKDELFRNVVSPPPQPTGTSGAAAKIDNDLALNDYLKSEVEKLRASAPAEEFAKLDTHLQALSQIRADITPGGGGQVLADCSTSPTLIGDPADQMGTLLAHALACGQTRVAVFRIGSYEPSHVHSHWQEGGMQGSDGDGCNPGQMSCHQAKFRAISRLWAQNVRNFLGTLDSFKEGAGTLLDNTCVVWSSEVSNHYQSADFPRNYTDALYDPYPISAGDVNTHGTVDMPFWIAGGLGGTLKTGQRIVAQDRWSGELYKAIGQAMGVSLGDLEGYGEASFAPGILQDILA